MLNSNNINRGDVFKRLNFQKNCAGNYNAKKDYKGLNSSKNASSSSISFMSIPLSTYRQALIIPILPENSAIVPKPYINACKKTALSDNLNISILSPGDKINIGLPVMAEVNIPKQSIQFNVFAQDPFITPDPQILTLKDKPEAGPINDRVETVFKRSNKASADINGNFILDPSTKNFDSSNSYFYINKALTMYEEVIGRKIPWGFGEDQIKIYPIASKSVNASYNRAKKSIKFNYFKNKFDKKETVYTSRIADIIAHEAGHAILDGIKPGCYNWGSHGSVIHEAFGDCTSVLVALWNDDLVKQVIKNTNGDLTKNNMIASLGEQFARAAIKGKKELRSAINNYKLSDFTRTTSSKDPHEIGQVMTGMFYDLFVSIAKEKNKSLDLKEAVFETRRDLTKLLGRAMADFLPAGNVYSSDVARALLKADQIDHNSKYFKALKALLIQREMITSDKVSEWEQQNINMPDIYLPENTLNSESSILKYVQSIKDKLKLDSAREYELESAYTNSFGETFIHLKSGKKFSVYINDGFGGNYQTIKVFDGLSLGFNTQNKLFHHSINKTSQEEVNDAIKDVQSTFKYINEKKSIEKDGTPMVYRESSKSNVLVKTPIFDY